MDARRAETRLAHPPPRGARRATARSAGTADAPGVFDASDATRLAEATAEQHRRRQLAGQPPVPTGQLPDLAPLLAAR